MKIKYFALLIGFPLLYSSCDSDMDNLAEPYSQETTDVTPNIQYSSGSANLSTFVTVGNSLTAGFSDGALFKKGQEVSVSNILADQFALAGGGTFTQPLMNDDVGGLLLGGNPILNPTTGDNMFPQRMFFDLGTQTPMTLNQASSTELTNILPGPYNNMGVPGAKTFHLVAPGYGDLANFPAAANPYFVRMASAPSTTVLADAMSMNPTFFSLWIGNNDVLGYAISGGDGSDAITDINTFSAAYGAIAGTLASNASGGIINNIPNVTDIPYFTTVPYAPLDPSNPDFGPLIPTLNGMFGLLNQVYVAMSMPERAVVFSETSASAVLIKDESLVDISAQMTQILATNPALPMFIQQFGYSEQEAQALAPLVAGLLGNYYGQTRQANANDLLVLPSSKVIGEINMTSLQNLMNLGFPQELAAQFSVEGITYGLDDKWVLLPTEQLEVENATTAFNQVIEQTASTYDLAFFDVNTFFSGVASSGYQAGSAFMTADYVTGGAFSLDGIHPSPRGNAVIANQMIQVINEKYGANLPNVNPVDYTGLYIN
ncbi:hypothetical protein IA57_06190 [Mangrovimonas yunxiaonensis]|uniref:G-D-S-L family lipolytic protein n=1 Tax=Mangrovimonas yunxiaonensis TaxID=1197477 RepID=A0A084TL28_9FLAO|nr:hypothetical protein [Mangrovimonas yunxiaonensis]KFB01414.1 hypothetical protein IA57_06190 [Mangrovimonas yunxiaonensis]MBR9756927.1 G-D-S-L family lipolytic protein [Algicola sp.]GGH36779.1 outer membrane protein [Mangrovimonas yunxiaonensis]